MWITQKDKTRKHPQCCLGDRGHMRLWLTKTQNYLETNDPCIMVVFTVWQHAEGLVSCQCMNNMWDAAPWPPTNIQFNFQNQIPQQESTSLPLTILHTHTHAHTLHCVVSNLYPCHGSKAGVWVCVCVRADLESRELMQAGLWQSSCPSARLIMQERHSRPPFILPGGEAVPACSPYHMALAPLSSLTHSLSLLGLLWMGLVLEERGSYWWCGGTPQHAV